MGLSTYSRNGIANGFINGVPFVVPRQCFSLHDGNPATGTNAATTLIGTDEERAQVTSSDATTGSTASTGDPATWSITEAATITYLGQHDVRSPGAVENRRRSRRPARHCRRRRHCHPVELWRDGGCLMPVLFDSTTQATQLIAGGSASGSKTGTHRCRRSRAIAWWPTWGAVDRRGRRVWRDVLGDVRRVPR